MLSLQEHSIQQLQWHWVRGQSDNMTDPAQLSLVKDVIQRGDVGFAPKFVMGDMMPPVNAKQVLKAMGMETFCQVSQPDRKIALDTVRSWLTRTKAHKTILNVLKLHFSKKIIQNPLLSKYITNQCSKRSPYLSPIHNGKLICF